MGAALTIGAAAYLISSRQDPGASQQPPPTAVTQTPTSLDLSVEATSTSAGASTSYTDAQLAEKFGDAVYRIEVSGCGSVGSGSGFAIDPHHVVTNQHVVNEDIEPTLVHRDGSRLQGRVIGWQFDPDIAVIEVSTTLPTSLTWAATSTLTLGDRVLGLGYPVPETDFSAIPGTIISFDDYQGIRRAIRTNATWDYGNSGGPALTETGEIAGVVTQFAANDGRQEVLLAFTPAVLEGPVADMIAFPSDVTSGCATAGEAQFEPGYIEGLEDYYPDPANPFWTAILMSVDYFTEDPNKAFDRAYEVLGLGLPVGLLVSDDFPSLRPGYLVVYSGRFATADDAKSWCAQISPIVGSCYHRNVGWDASYR
ncbi:MAG TPA: serine protease [Acidimicrobiia bacterium]|nr:serine protease [Acidimicrobiia bacterium]